MNIMKFYHLIFFTFIEMDLAKECGIDVKTVNFQIKMPDGRIKEVAVHRHYNRHTDHISEEYDKLLQAYYDCGAAKKVKFGDADCILCDARGLYEVTKTVLSHEINCLIDRKEIPEEWWKE